MRPRSGLRVLALVPVLALTLSSCGAEPRDELRVGVAAVTQAANAADVARVRAAVEELLATVRRQVASGELDVEDGERISTLALRIAKNAEALAPVVVPSTTPEPEPTPEPEETEEPEPEETEEPEPEPEKTKPPKPEKTKEPEPEPSPILEIFPEETQSPALDAAGRRPAETPASPTA